MKFEVMLKRAGIGGPLILVGHSLGGAMSQDFSRRAIRERLPGW